MSAEFIVAQAQYIAEVFQQARTEIRAASPSVSDPTVLRNLSAAPRRDVPTFALIGATPQFDVVDGVVYPSKPLYGHEQASISHLAARGVKIFINPQFSPMGASELQIGAMYGASFIVTGHGKAEFSAVLCTGPFDHSSLASKAVICAKHLAPPAVGALYRLHMADFDDLVEQEVRDDLVTEAAKALVVSPGGIEKIRAMVAGAKVIDIWTDRVELDSPVMRALLAAGSKTRLHLSGSTAKALRATIELPDSLEVLESERPLIGTVIATARAHFMGSHSLTVDAFSRQRHVGMIFTGIHPGPAALLGGAK